MIMGLRLLRIPYNAFLLFCEHNTSELFGYDYGF